MYLQLFFIIQIYYDIIIINITSVLFRTWFFCNMLFNFIEPDPFGRWNGFFIFMKLGTDLVGDYYALSCMTRTQCIHSSFKNPASRSETTVLQLKILRVLRYRLSLRPSGMLVGLYCSSSFFCMAIATGGTGTRQTAICRNVPTVVRSSELSYRSPYKSRFRTVVVLFSKRSFDTYCIPFGE